jgi:hypothetical protein
MAQIDLGSIKFNWKGSYSGATAYVVDDVVESSGSSYICIAATTGNAPPNATYWELMSQAGTNGTDGTDLGTTLTTQGDIVYRDASGLARLGAGTSGQALITNGTGANPSWGDVSGGLLQVVSTNKTNTFNFSSSSFVDITGLSLSITPSSTSSKILIFCHLSVGNDGYHGTAYKIMRGSTDVLIGDTASNRIRATFSDNMNPDNGLHTHMVHAVDSPSTTSAITYKIQALQAQSATCTINGWRPSGDTDNSTRQRTTSVITAMEIGV